MLPAPGQDFHPPQQLRESHGLIPQMVGEEEMEEEPAFAVIHAYWLYWDWSELGVCVREGV